MRPQCTSHDWIDWPQECAVCGKMRVEMKTEIEWFRPDEKLPDGTCLVLVIVGKDVTVRYFLLPLGRWVDALDTTQEAVGLAAPELWAYLPEAPSE